MFILVVVFSFLGLVLLPVVFLLDPLEVKLKLLHEQFGASPASGTKTVEIPNAAHKRIVVSRAK
jgi:hypothetical protein